MKKNILFTLVLALLVSFCSSAAAQQEPERNETNILVLYFSRTGEQYTVGVIEKGNTAIVAEMIAEQITTLRKLSRRRMADSAGKTTRAEISRDPTRFIPSTIITAIKTAIIKL